jgi:sirohydrochlorin ferrochelatase
MTTESALPTALLLIAHGSRRQEANEDLDYLAEQLRARGRFAFVQKSFLELTEPTIAAGGALCVSAGARRIIMLPYFLSAGVHVHEDLQAARRDLATHFPQVEFRLARPLGPHPLLVELVAQRAEEVFG